MRDRPGTIAARNKAPTETFNTLATHQNHRGRDICPWVSEAAIVPIARVGL